MSILIQENKKRRLRNDFLQTREEKEIFKEKTRVSIIFNEKY